MFNSKPHIVVIVGAPSSGKTKLGRAIAAKLHLAISDKDHVTGQLLAAMMKDAGFEGEDYSQTSLNRFRKAIYGCMEDVAKDNLRANMGTVIISPYIDRGEEGWFEALKQRVDPDGEAVWDIVWIDITPDLALGRIQARNSPRDVIKVKTWPEFAAKTFWGAPSCEHLRVDAAEEFDVKLKQVVKYLTK